MSSDCKSGDYFTGLCPWDNFPTWPLVSSLTKWSISLCLWISSKSATSGDYRPLIACPEHLTRSRYTSREGWETVMDTFECGKMSLGWVIGNAVGLLYTMCCVWQEFHLALETWFQYWLQYLEPGLIIRIIFNQWNLTQNAVKHFCFSSLLLAFPLLPPSLNFLLLSLSLSADWQ